MTDIMVLDRRQLLGAGAGGALALLWLPRGATAGTPAAERRLQRGFKDAGVGTYTDSSVGNQISNSVTMT